MECLSPLKAAVLACLAGAGEALHAGAVLGEVQSRIGQVVNRGALARTLLELGAEGLARSRHGASSSHGGPKRVLYQITGAGRAALAGHVRAVLKSARVRRISALAQAYLLDPPKGSKVAAARDYGVSLALLSRALLQSHSERYREAVSAINAFSRYSG